MDPQLYSLNSKVNRMLDEYYVCSVSIGDMGPF
jgi:hypothetical protein